VIQRALATTSLPETYIQAVHTREDVSSLLSLDRYIDLVIPRGSNSLVRAIQNSTRIPVMGHADGLCNIFVDESAKLEKAVRVVLDSKVHYSTPSKLLLVLRSFSSISSNLIRRQTDYPAACNAVETLLLHESVLPTLWPSIANSLLTANVQLLCDPPSLSVLQQNPPQKFETHVRGSKDEDYSTEHLTLTLSVLTVPSLSTAIKHINSHSSHHTDSIVTESGQNASTFIRGVDSAGAFWNASTRFADGFRYGFGTEVGISTGRIHARGPVGLEGLVSYKYVLRSKSDSGHIVGEYGSGEGKKKFKHTEIKADILPF